jgi:hypothetical protein
MENDEKDERLISKFSGIFAAMIRPEQVKGSHMMYRQIIGIKAHIKTIDAHHRHVRIASVGLNRTKRDDKRSEVNQWW